MQARFHRPARDAQDAGRLGLVETVQIAQHEDGTLVGRQALEHAAHVARHFWVVAAGGERGIAERNVTGTGRRATRTASRTAMVRTHP